ncbi:hypothetical protein Pmar_PMAR005003 [Perkinsus marinus ATCC 50983]|uniref:Uncharacterized protein n=1 Tax=Perkinsus marinus (strain ATCC 50983 / TXsc) TaxID=423536 RepID=C5L6T0_PERM5|nr:hypothetical protein Pmar_PMAR005003 [Perkinsus marinus ATCC 50983]EER07570.1 hypothetical protein Pmar_PMAR005003 [Perkinsus marinus ATCC 50983]|eukprot:XP_002775754.1 hypothetical protein Pmar_PMAR005003 [Perkinsus marinus ATCC 50983]
MEVLHLITSLIICGMGVRGHVVYRPCIDGFRQYGEYIIRIEFKLKGNVLLTYQENPLGPEKVYTCVYHFDPKEKEMDEGYVPVLFLGPECQRLVKDSKGRLNGDSLKPFLTFPNLDYLYMKLPSRNSTALYKNKGAWPCPV